ncbi:MAG: methyltransferase domain-containing protein [Firmicutes bacterium]|nr:methyltransferase domain-containing protein [Bacillota bacterium]
MDERTLYVYETNAEVFSKQYRSAEPMQLYHLITAFFHPGEPTVDIGSGSGRDVAWLSANGFPAVGYDALPRMVAEARASYPGIDTRQDSLPDLKTIPDNAYSNVLCSATIMHLPRQDLITAAFNLARILKPGGRLILTYRPSQADGEREADGRLYTSIPPGKLVLLLESTGLKNLAVVKQRDAWRPEIAWHVIVSEKGADSPAHGLNRIQGVLVQDRKVATYKFALIRALCHVSRYEPHVARWGRDDVYVPLASLAVRWLIYYWPVVNAPDFISQMHGEKPGGKNLISFRRTVQDLAGFFGLDGLYAVLNHIDEEPGLYVASLKRIADAIRWGPVTYAGTKGPRLFRFVRRLPAQPGDHPGDSGPDDPFGWVVVPQPIWMDISRFDHWIEDSIVVRWAQLTVEMNPGITMSEVLPLLLASPGARRGTDEVRQILRAADTGLECVWSGQPLKDDYNVDHVIPYSVWGNSDLWNMLPCLPRLNNEKRDCLPTQRLLDQREDAIDYYWRLYRSHLPKRFDTQVRRALGSTTTSASWERLALSGLKETVEKLASTRGLLRWEPRG